MKVPCKEALDKFAEKGAEVDFETQIVKIPRSMVEEAVNSAPSSFVLYGREERHNIYLEGKRTYMGTGGTALNVLDMETGEKRRSNLQDLKDLACLVDALDNIHLFMLNVFPHELEAENADVNRFWWAMNNTSKHIMGGVYSIEGIRNVVKIAEEIVGGPKALREKPIISMVTCIMSPLLMDKKYARLLMEVASLGIPVVTPTETLAGATGPCTLAGTVTVANAETLAGIVLSQLVNPGTPVLYGQIGTTIDMKKGSYLSGNIEMGLINAANTQMAHYYKIPIYATAGMSDSKVPDVQAGYEKMATNMITALAGANFVHDAAGFLEFCTVASFEQMVIDDEIIGMCMRAVKGVEVNEESLAEEVVKAVKPGGNFLTHPHTLKHCRQEYFLPTLADRNTRKEWEKLGAKDGAQRAKEKAKAILSEHKPLPMEQSVVDKINAKAAEMGIINPHNQ